MAERGRCGGCGGVYSVTSKGVIRSHWSRFPAPSEAQFGRTHYGRCSGLGMPPIGPDEPLHRTEVSDLRRELAAARQDNQQLRNSLTAWQAHARAWEARAKSMGYIGEANKHLLAALKSMMESDQGADERAERFEAEMAKIRAQFPDVYEGRRR